MEKSYRLVEDIGKDKKENGVQEIDDSNGDVEGVRLFVHPGPKNANGDEGNRFNDNKCDTLNSRRRLSESNENCFDDNVYHERQDEVIRCSTKLNVEEAPLVQSLGVRV